MVDPKVVLITFFSSFFGVIILHGVMTFVFNSIPTTDFNFLFDIIKVLVPDGSDIITDVIWVLVPTGISVVASK